MLTTGLAVHSGQGLVPECQGQRIGVLDIGDFAASRKFAVCDTSYVVVNSGDGTVYLNSQRDQLGPYAVDHQLGAHAAPWHLKEAIKSSPYYTEDLDEADIVYVYDYCYYIWWLATVHTLGRNLEETPGDSLMEGYHAMMETPKWQERGGENFVFYDSHPGFMAGDAARPVQQLKCFHTRTSVHLIMDVPMRYVCGNGWPYNKLLVTPYNPTGANLSLPAVHPGLPAVPLEAREYLLYLRSACAQPSTAVNNFNAGKMMRQHLAAAFAGEEEDVQVKCSNHGYPASKGGAKRMEYKDMFQEMQKSVFCLVLPGDAASTRRFSEIMTAGCIPVFVGPPYHSMPFIQDIDYRNAAVFFAVDNHSPWMESKMEKWLDPRQKAQHETEARWWLPDADISGRAIRVRSVEDIIPRLRDFTNEEAAQKLALVAHFRHYFSFEPRLTEPPNAVNALLAGICKRAPLEPENS